MRAPNRPLHVAAQILCLSVALFAAACGGDDAPPAAPSTGTPPPTSGGPITVTGTEKIGWDQVADSATQLSRYQFLGFVDDVSQVLTNASCGTTADRKSVV